MKFLLDTHVFLWWIMDSPQISENARKLMSERSSDLFWSSASSWEIAVKYANGKLPLPDEPEVFIMSELSSNRISSLSITDEHSFMAGMLPIHHRDPFDRMLIAQSNFENMPLITSDQIMSQYEVKTIW
ncbi:MAG: type II toxin-antitoxin system VapC family toxin [Deltaproteobacteria bacterium]|jgi:PIN domain nuclease of toxin-antitoxin system|nr:type II toxin-antitoxin system VapC family toxin [Deltaproteobacteria bacterium]MBT4639309.1 type II toxin-antitoxin system VapC family toxin [Deltaproteobacteria bacterium]MBT6498664.1 type II toxin-antitoxin system VapC family toxin [Deltaproteobacteria bacterium]